MKECPQELIDAHWEYTASVMSVSGATQMQIDVAEHAARTYAKHFWKHAKEDSETLINKLNEEIAETQRRPAVNIEKSCQSCDYSAIDCPDSCINFSRWKQT